MKTQYTLRNRHIQCRTAVVFAPMDCYCQKPWSTLQKYRRSLWNWPACWTISYWSHWRAVCLVAWELFLVCFSAEDGHCFLAVQPRKHGSCCRDTMTLMCSGWRWSWYSKFEAANGALNGAIGASSAKNTFFRDIFQKNMNKSTAEFCCFVTEALVGFLDFYGHRFDPQSLGVRRWRGLHHRKPSEDVLNPRRSAIPCFWEIMETHCQNCGWMSLATCPTFASIFPNQDLISSWPINLPSLANRPFHDFTEMHFWRLYGVSVARSAFLPRKSPLSWPPQQASKPKRLSSTWSFVKLDS